MQIVLRLMLVFIPVVMALAQARAQADTVYAGQSSVWKVVAVPGDSYEWELYNDVTGINFATDPGNCPASEAYFVGGVNTGDSVEVMWLVPGTYFIKVNGTNSCTNNIKVGKIVVLESQSVATFLDPAAICTGDTAMLTLEITGGGGPWDVTFTDGDTTWTIEGITASPYTFQLIPTPTTPGTYQYWVTSVTSGTGFVNNTPGDPVELIVHPKPVTSPIINYGP